MKRKEVLPEILPLAVYIKWKDKVNLIILKNIIAPSRRDDIIAILYMLIFLEERKLPWLQKIHNANNFAF